MRISSGLVTILLIGAGSAWAADEKPTAQATGVKVGEVTTNSALIWTRLTALPERNRNGIRVTKPATRPAELRAKDLEGACPGAPGRIRVRYAPNPHLTNVEFTDWAEARPETDFAHTFRLSGLKPDTEYFYGVETAEPDGTPHAGLVRGRFRTAPPADEAEPVLFTVITCMMYSDLDAPDGFKIFDSMAELKPQFIVETGDSVYYDNEEPRAVTVELARYHWHRMYSLPRLVRFHLQVPGFWEKDDHDTLCDDCWPTDAPVAKFEAMRPMTFKDGQRIFREEVPMGERTYRTVRWGRDLEVWLVEGRDFRSPNTMEDGPNKSLWGAEQKRWLKETLTASDATWKILVSPTPIVGPDRPQKADNHANEAFAHEGNEMRRWFRDNLPNNFFIANGDRHWQYHSIDPETGVQEFGCGPASDEHAAGTPGENPRYHQFHRVKGGFLSIRVDRKEGVSTIVLQHHDVKGVVMHEFRKTLPVR